LRGENLAHQHILSESIFCREEEETAESNVKDKTTKSKKSKKEKKEKKGKEKKSKKSHKGAEFVHESTGSQNFMFLFEGKRERDTEPAHATKKSKVNNLFIVVDTCGDIGIFCFLERR
jgi:hypothetical protein